MAADTSDIFRSIDVRGIYKKHIDEDVFRKIGKAFSGFAKGRAVIGRDMRLSSPSLKNALVEGILETGTDVIDLDEFPVGVVTFWGWKNKAFSAYVTASHLGKDWNGIKFFDEKGHIFTKSNNLKIKEKFFKGDHKGNGKGKYIRENKEKIMSEFNDYLSGKIKIHKKLRLAFDPGNGMAAYHTSLLKSLSHVESVNSKIDGTFPSRSSNIDEDNLTSLKKIMKDNDIGMAFDGDADRLVIMDEKGRKFSSEQTAFLILRELLKENQGDIVANAECSKLIDKMAEQYSRKVIRVPVGHTFMMQAVAERNACFGVEKSGHMTIPLLAGFHDMMHVALYILYCLSNSEKKLSELYDEMPVFDFCRATIKCDDRIKYKVVENIKESLSDTYKNINTLDGIRVDSEDYWVLVRASNTEPVIRVTAEASNRSRLKELIENFSRMVEDKLRNYNAAV